MFENWSANTKAAIAAIIFSMAFTDCACAKTVAESSAHVTAAASRAMILADGIANMIMRIAPYKRFDLHTKTADMTTGRTPGSACEALKFLIAYSQVRPDNKPVNEKIESLAQWIARLQATNRDLPSYGGVPSTPDLPFPQNQYYYAIDSAFCADAMIRLYRRSYDTRYLRSAVAFADHLVAMQGGPESWPLGLAAAPYGFCEFSTQENAHAAWNCDAYVKLFVALAPLKEISRLTGNPLYYDVALKARHFLVPGLSGAWEYAEAPGRCCSEISGEPHWRRISGSHGEKDWFVYGDTLAYALSGLYQFDEDRTDVKKLYLDFTAYGPGGPRTQTYDGRIAYAGYLAPQTRTADDLSAYYDLTTLGILYPLRAELEPEDAKLSSDALLKYMGTASSASWLLRMDFSAPAHEIVDITTLANIGMACLSIR
jgi:hypothetical protein